MVCISDVGLSKSGRNQTVFYIQLDSHITVSHYMIFFSETE